MSKKNEHDLENQENWDYEHLETREPVKAPRVVVSVAFRRQDFEKVSEYAEHLGKKVSEFIREAALEKAVGRASVTFDVFGGAGSLWFGNNFPNTTQVHTLAIERETRESVITSG